MMTLQKTAVVFPGQGSQSVGMLSNIILNKDKKNNYDIVSALFKTASEILDYDLLKIISEGPAEKLNQTEITQPALLVASVICWKLWERSDNFKNNNITVLAGHSLGEYSALVCAGVLTFEDAISCVANRGKFMQEAVPEGQGAMAAIIGLDFNNLEKICDQAAEGKTVSPANINAPGQIVIAGEIHAVERAMDLAKKSGAKLVKKLDVSVPSHCALMNSAAEKLKKLLEKLKFNIPNIPVIQNTHARVENNLIDIKQALFQQLSQPVKWVHSMEVMARDFTPEVIIECGPGKILAGLNKRIINIPTVSIEDVLHV